MSVGNPLNLLFGAAGALLKPFGVGASKPPAMPVPLPTINRADAMAGARADELRKRRGAGANELTGGGAEAVTPGGKALLGQ